MLAGLPEKMVTWESKGLPNEKIKPTNTGNNNLSPKTKSHN